MDRAHEVFDAVGFVPGLNIPASAASAVWYGAEGKWGEAALAAGAIVPGGKYVTTAGKGIVKGVKFLKGLRRSEEIATDAAKGERELAHGLPPGGAGNSGLGASKSSKEVEGPLQGPSLPVGVRKGWQSRPADNGPGVVWQRPGSYRDSNSARIMEPGANPRYPNGYVKFTNEYNQPIELNGKPMGRELTNIQRRLDGTYDLPKGW